VLGECISHPTVADGTATAPLLSLHLLLHGLRKYAPESGNKNNIASISIQYAIDILHQLSYYIFVLVIFVAVVHIKNILSILMYNLLVNRL